MSRRFLQLDVFAERPGCGNPLAVVVDADGLDDATMQAFARWTQLSETVFLFAPSPGADYRVRIFTPTLELPFAGHPSVGAAWAALECGLATPAGELMLQECGAGQLPVRVGPGRTIAIRAPRAQRLDDPAGAARVEALLAGTRRGALAPALWSNGPRWWLAELTDEAQVRTWRPDLAAITALANGDASVGFAVFATVGDDVVVRAFCPADGVPEDPVTGSVNAMIAAALAEAGRLSRGAAYTAHQGREVGRDGRIEVRIDDDGEVWIGGRVQRVIQGTLDW
ncbi:MAG TPA: PhzF family phenazine biosynthesis protein [Lysobacter sp.]|nr:PhzF family phenazine biosynthesis protein [Lysobacter sp.]